MMQRHFKTHLIIVSSKFFVVSLASLQGAGPTSWFVTSQSLEASCSFKGEFNISWVFNIYILLLILKITL